MGNSIEERLAQLEEQGKMLEPSHQERVDLFNQYHQVAEHFLEGLRENNTFNNGASTPNRYTLDGQPEDIQKTIDTIENDLFVYGINAASGGHLGYIPGGGIYASSIGDYLAAISNAYSGVYYASPGAVEMEHACLNWVKSIFGFPSNAVGNLTSGGSIANMIGLCAARDYQRILENGVEKNVIYLTEHTHHSVKKSLKILGLKQVIVREIKVDSSNQMDITSLEYQIIQDNKNGLHPAIIVASAGTTDTGAVDPLNSIADIAEKYKVWFHVDAAYGGFFILADSVKDKFKGIERADSMICDPHKSLFLPYGSGCVLIKNKEAVFTSHKVSAHYMQDTVEEELPIDPSDVSPELTKHFRALRMWLPLKTYGIAPFKSLLEEKLLLTEYFRQKVVTLGFNVGPTPNLSVTYFWYPKVEDEDSFNHKLMQLCHQDGSVFLSSSRIDNRFVIRMAILSFRTHKYEIDKCIAMLQRNLQLI
ncbi:MAG: aminotransferase class V-fold PLP-dependent enzyme [Brumimicrobium sp.]|nr:aminotransferase class V-fold PLP-dependent enzyme [Brumimicrobium sp.]MCO5267538.1 aminotransferase class I/II-fold pyridoxal phosphate-dependent enzyme [Brumimicrobium sp.]